MALSHQSCLHLFLLLIQRFPNFKLKKNAFQIELVLEKDREIEKTLSALSFLEVS